MISIMCISPITAQEMNKEYKNLTLEDKTYMRQFTDMLYYELGDDLSLHLSGYATLGYTDSENSENGTTSGDFNPIFHLLYGDKWMLEGEIELNTDSNPGGIQDELGYLALNYFLNDYVTFQIGKFLSPIGQFRQNLHPSWINKLGSAPLGFGHDGAAPISNTGIQLRGGFPLAETKINYAFFIANAPELVREEGHGDDEDEIELELNTEANFSRHNKTNQFGGRIGFQPVSNFELGISYARAKAKYKNEESRNYQVSGIDFYYRPDFMKELTLRGEYLRTFLGSGGNSDSESKTLEAYYCQASYQLNSKVELVGRYGAFDNNGTKTSQFYPGINYLISSNCVLKAGYEFNENLDNRIVIQLALGF